MDVRVGLWRKLSAEELMLLNCGVGEESPLGCKEIEPVHPKGNQSWIFVGRPDAEAETPILWPPDAKNRLIGKDPDAGKDWSQEEKGMTEGKIVGCYPDSMDCECEQTLGVGDGQGGLGSQRVRHDRATELNWMSCTHNILHVYIYVCVCICVVSVRDLKDE